MVRHLQKLIHTHMSSISQTVNIYRWWILDFFFLMNVWGVAWGSRKKLGKSVLLHLWVELPLRGGKRNINGRLGISKTTMKKLHLFIHHEIQFQLNSTVWTWDSKDIIYR